MYLFAPFFKEAVLEEEGILAAVLSPIPVDSGEGTVIMTMNATVLQLQHL